MTMQEMIPDYISMIRESNDIDEQVRLLEELNARLPKEKRLLFPSLFTSHYVSKAVNTIEEIWFERIRQQSTSDEI
jgi:hypothetical protein